MKKEEHDKIVLLFTYFGSNINLLVKYLLDNKAFNSDFIDKICNSDFIKNNKKIDFNFKNIKEVDTFLMSIILEQESITILNNKLKEYVNSEDYENAAKLRDYISIKKDKNI